MIVITFLTFFFSARHRASLRNARSPSLSEVNAHLKETAAQDEVIQRYLARLKQKLGLWNLKCVCWGGMGGVLVCYCGKSVVVIVARDSSEVVGSIDVSSLSVVTHAVLFLVVPHTYILYIDLILPRL